VGSDDWRSRRDLTADPICSGAESFLAGTGSCRVEVKDVDGLFGEPEVRGVLHDVSGDGVVQTDFGTREFSAVDLDGNLLTLSQDSELVGFGVGVSWSRVEKLAAAAQPPGGALEW
jgi:hypothetical protein